MGCVAGLTNDVFISYAHVDNRQAFGAEQQGLVTRLYNALEVLVAQRMGRRERLSIWMDKKLRGNDRFDPEIEKYLDQSAVLVSALSPGYVASTACLKELDSFEQAVQKSRFGVSIENKSRIFRVNLDLLRADQSMPPILEGMDGYDLYRLDEASGRVSRLHGGQVFEETVANLAREIADLLVLMGKTPPVVQHSLPAATVYLGAVTDDLQARRDELSTALEQYGVTVWPERDNQPGTREEWNRLVLSDLQRSSLFIQLVGDSYGRYLFDDENNLSASESQYGLALQAAGEGKLGAAKRKGDNTERKPVIVWSPPELKLKELTDERQKAFLRRIGNENSPYLEWLRQGIEDLKDLCFDRLGIERRRLATAASDTGAMVFLACTPEARENQDYQKIVECLRNRGHNLQLPTWHGDPELPFERVRYSDGVLILYVADASPVWAEARAAEVIKIAKRRKLNPMVAAVYDGPPPERPDLPFEFRTVKPVRARQGFDPQALAPFIEDLERLVAT